MGRYSTTMDPETTRALGSGYLLESEIGGGATGRVWRAVRRADGAQVAVKVLRSEFAREADSVVRFLRQRTVLAQVGHPHLVRVHDLVAEGEVLAVVMDLVEGRDLRQVIRETPLSRDQATAILTQVASALSAVHAAGVVHRDVKPENVLVRWDGEAVPHAMLTDFGLAKMLDSPLWTSASQLHGTPAYLAPEVVTGRPAGPESDVYALSVMAYELLAGERPVRADNPAALLLAHLGAEVARPPGLPDGLWRLLQSGLAKEPEARPTAAEFAARIANPHEETTASTLDAIRPAPPAPREPKRRRKRWLLWAAGAMCLVLGMGAGLWAGRPSTGQPQPSKPGPTPYQYFLTVTATSLKPGEIRLTFPDAKGLPGFESYLIFRDKQVIEQFIAGNENGYTYLTEDHQTEYCFEVAALLLTDNPPAAPVSKPACASANGKPRE